MGGVLNGFLVEVEVEYVVVKDAPALPGHMMFNLRALNGERALDYGRAAALKVAGVIKARPLTATRINPARRGGEW
jgi:hypothetical protein